VLYLLCFLPSPKSAITDAAMIGADESKQLLQLLIGESSPFDETIAEFVSRFPPDSRTRVCSTLPVLLEVSDPITPSILLYQAP
jgi:hypothetical protein